MQSPVRRTEAHGGTGQEKALEQEIESEAGQVADVGRFLQLAERYSDLQELDAATANELIEEIVIRIPLSKPEPLAATEKPA